MKKQSVTSLLPAEPAEWATRAATEEILYECTEVVGEENPRHRKEEGEKSRSLAIRRRMSTSARGSCLDVCRQRHRLHCRGSVQRNRLRKERTQMRPALLFLPASGRWMRWVKMRGERGGWGGHDCGKLNALCTGARGPDS